MNSNDIVKHLSENLSSYSHLKGVKYLTLLLTNQNRELTYINLYYYLIDKPENQTNEGIYQKSWPMTDRKTINDVLRRMKQINDIGNGLFDKNIEKEKEQLKQYLHEVIQNGKILNFSNEFTKCKKSIIEVIRRTLNEMKTLNPDAYQYISDRLQKTTNSIILHFDNYLERR